MTFLQTRAARARLRHEGAQAAGQRGVTLIVVLLFMSVLAMGGLYSARSALLSERLARNQLDMQVARQAAEAALRDAEVDLAIKDGANTMNGASCARGQARPTADGAALFTSDCLAGQCAAPKPSQFLAAKYADSTAKAPGNAEAWWPEEKGGKWNGASNHACDAKGGVKLGTFTGAQAIQGVARQPEYLIEQMDRGGKPYFRITARGFGYRTSTEVVVQSYFKIPEL